MIIARQKKEENIVEYVIYMFQIEDAIRANNFDKDSVKRNLVDKYNLSQEELDETERWYNDLVDSMLNEGVRKSGHLKLIDTIILELNDYHLLLLKSENKKYTELYSWALPNIERMREKSRRDLNEVEICINSLYMIILMRLQQKDISTDTLEAISTFSSMLAYLAHQFKSKST